MKEAIYYDQWLQGLGEFPAKAVERVQERFPTAQELLRAPAQKLEEILSEGQLRRILDARRRLSGADGMREAYEKLAEKGICYVSRRQGEYPARLKEIPDPPTGLYYLGRLPQERSLSVAVVGARECSQYGVQVASELGKALGRSGMDVISGMARGVDGISQRAALEAGGASFGVLGCGADVCYPASNRQLYDALRERGGILSEYPPDTPPLSRYFPPRNRIVSGLADVVVVVEARQKSGTLITVDMALEQGKEVYVVPGRVTDRLSDGCNRLLKQGAEIYLGADSFLEELGELAFLKKIAPWGARAQGGKKKEEAGDGAQGKKEEANDGALQDGEKDRFAPLRRVLDDTPKSVEEIALQLGGSNSSLELSVLLMELVVEGGARQVSTGCFCRA